MNQSDSEWYADGRASPGHRSRRFTYQAQWYQALAETHDSGPRVTMPFIWAFSRANWYMESPYSQGGGGIHGEQPTISVTEFYVTSFDYFVWRSAEESEISELHPGKVLGILIYVADRDEHENKPSCYYHLGEFGDLSDTFADFVLMGPGGEIPEISAVESITWARIKARFVQ